MKPESHPLNIHDTFPEVFSCNNYEFVHSAAPFQQVFFLRAVADKLNTNSCESVDRQIIQKFIMLT